MNAQLAQQIAQLRDLTMAELRERYQDLFGDRSRTMNRQFLFRRIAWRMQALAEGDLSERARNRALLLARDADLRIRPCREFHAFTIEGSKRDWRLPPVGRTLKRTYGGALHTVKVCADGFDYQGQKYQSLSAVAFSITGTRWNGFSFFGLQGAKRG
jgi:erythromycin esterase-like protein